VVERGERCRLPAAALIEENDAIHRRIEIAPVLRLRAAARAAMEEHHGLAVRIAALFPVELVDGRDLQTTGSKRLDVGVQDATILDHRRASSILTDRRRRS